jgi:hypothetical protein
LQRDAVDHKSVKIADHSRIYGENGVTHDISNPYSTTAE